MLLVRCIADAIKGFNSNILKASYLHPTMIEIEQVLPQSVKEDVPYKGKYDGWGLFIMNAVYELQKSKDAFEIHENGHTYYEVRLAFMIADEFMKRTKQKVWPSTIYKFEQEAAPHADYATRIAQACWVHELKLKGIQE